MQLNTCSNSPESVSELEAPAGMTAPEPNFSQAAAAFWMNILIQTRLSISRCRIVHRCSRQTFQTLKKSGGPSAAESEGGLLLKTTTKKNNEYLQNCQMWVDVVWQVWFFISLMSGTCERDLGEREIIYHLRFFSFNFFKKAFANLGKITSLYYFKFITNIYI